MTNKTKNKFLYEIKREIKKNIFNDFHDNFDYYRFGNRLPPNTIKNIIKSILFKIRLFKLVKLWKQIYKKRAHFELLFTNLYDKESKVLLIKLMVFRLLGHRKVKLPLNTKDYWNTIENLSKLVNHKDFIESGFHEMFLYKTDLKSLKIPIIAYLTPISVYNSFILEQYRGVTENKIIQAEAGDYIIDAGACWGNTSLYFSYKVGSKGKVCCIEFIPRNIEIIKKNFELNPSLSENIFIIENPIWSESDIPIYYYDKGPGSKVTIDKFNGKMEPIYTVTIDDIVKINNLSKVDFIKMDIEGAELPALKGTINTILNYKPKLAISVYHKLSDFYNIPEFLNSLAIGYKYILRHYTIHAEETVLFAWVDK